MSVYRTGQLFDLTRTIAAPLFSPEAWPWLPLDHIADFIRKAGPALPADRFDNPADGVWIAKSATVAPSASINGPCIIDEEAEIRHCAYVRGSAVIGKGAVVGNSTEIKNAILFDGAQVPHFNYVGDSILGHKAHLGAGVIATNLKSDQTQVLAKAPGLSVETGRRKLGVMAGDFAEVGCNSALAPGCILGRRTTVYPGSFVRGQVPEGHIFKSQDNIVERK